MFVSSAHSAPAFEVHMCSFWPLLQIHCSALPLAKSSMQRHKSERSLHAPVLTYVSYVGWCADCTSMLVIMQGQQPVGGLDYYKDPNLYTNHLHGYFGNPGTNVAPCNKTHESDAFCVGGDNIFIDIYPGQCGEYRMPIAPISSPGVYW